MAKLLSASGYQGNNMALPVSDVDSAAQYYVRTMGFVETSRRSEPHERIVLERDGIQIALEENGGDPEQDGCAFGVDRVDELRDEFLASGLTGIGEISEEKRDDGSKYKVFFVVAPDGLCYWFGEKIGTT